MCSSDCGEFKIYSPADEIDELRRKVAELEKKLEE